MQITFLYVDDSVEQSWEMIAETFHSFLVVSSSRCAVDEPLAIRETVFQFVTVEILFLGT